MGTNPTASPQCAPPQGAHFAAAGPPGPRSALRLAIDRATRLPEPQALAPLLLAAQLAPQPAARAQALARQWVTALRQGPRLGAGLGAGLVPRWLQEYPLASDEGVALLGLAEAVLRIPDAATRLALIRDKIGPRNWQSHLGHSPWWFVNAASWGLLLTGRLLAPPPPGVVPGRLARLARHGLEPLMAPVLASAMRLLGRQFVMGQTIAQALRRAKAMEAQGFRYSYDMLGEAALTEDDAQRYFAAYARAIEAIGQASAGRGVENGPGVSVKLSALHPRYTRAQYQGVMAQLYPRLLQLTELARRHDIGLTIDAEETERLDLSLDLLERLCHAPSLAGWGGLGFALQAYQKRCPQVISFVLDLAQRSGHRLMIRLVKGAYWDSEIKRAQQDGLSDYPVYTRKHHSDVAYLACARQLLAAPQLVYPQFATHNAHTVATITQMALALAAPGRYEFQCLHGMGQGLYRQLVGANTSGPACRIYAPVGSHHTLLAYLVRRLLENGANSSFVNRLADPDLALDELLRDPVARTLNEAQRQGQAPGQPNPTIPLPLALYGAARPNSVGFDWHDEATLRTLAEQMAQWGQDAWQIEPMIEPLGLAQAPEGGWHALRHPADPADRLGQVRHASPAQVEQALQAAGAAAPLWAAHSPAARAILLEQAADGLQAQAPQAMALLVREGGKSWPHAGAEVREAVDFLRYYAAQVRRDFDNATHPPLGPVLCISPWNFPLAIFVGQVAAALAAGNTVLAKPAEATPAIAALAVQVLWRAGVPRGAVQLLPGRGHEVGMALAQDRRVQAVLFTGSGATGRLLQTALAQRLNSHGQPVPLIAETGGQNAMVVDASALLEQVVSDAIASAFEGAGQRCSALRVLCVQDDVAARLITLLQGAMAQCQMGPPAQLAVDIGPVIDPAARDAIEAHVAHMAARGCKVYRSSHNHPARLPAGSYVQPTLIEINRMADLQDEVFGPVLHVLRYPRARLDQLLQDIQATGYALTLGVHSRIDTTIGRVIKASRAGNVYVNRSLVGAVVGVQPFGGEGLSGTGPKAGGPLYLLRLLHHSPPDAARRALQAAGTAATWRPAGPALASLRTWALAHQRQPLAALCEQQASCNPAGLQTLLPGPTGERNEYRTQARARVWCQTGPQPSAQDDRLNQLATVLAVGSQAVWHEAARALWRQLPSAVQSQITLCADIAAGLALCDAAVVHGEAATVLQLSQALARQPGPIVSLTALAPGDAAVPLARLISERSICTNTAAWGGNAALMAAG